MLRAAGPDGDGGGEVHDAVDGAEDSGAVVDEPDELPHIRPAPEIEHAAQGRVVVALCADLDEEDAALEMIHDGLPPVGGPPFDGDVGLTPGGNDPIRDILADDLLDPRRPSFFQRMKMDVALEMCGADAEAELEGEVLSEAVDGVEGGGVALVAQRGDVGIVEPRPVEGRARIGEEPARMRAVQLADGGGGEDDVAEGIPAAENELLPARVRMRGRVGRCLALARTQPGARGAACSGEGGGGRHGMRRLRMPGGADRALRR